MLRKRSISLSLACAVVTLTACSGSGGDGSGSEAGRTGPAGDPELAALMAATAAKVSDARTYRFEGTVVYPAGAESFEVTLTGAADTGSGGAVGEAEVAPFRTMELDLSRSPLSQGGLGATPMIVEGGTFYLRFPDGAQPGTGMGPAGKLWGKFDVAALDEGAVAGFKSLLDQAGAADPGRFLALLTGAGDVVEVGAEKVRETDTRHFTMTADVEEVAGNAPSEFVDAAQGMLETIGGVPVSIDAWLGPDGLPRRIAYRIDPSLERDIASATIELFDYGTHVDRTVPPPADVFDFRSLTDAGG